MNSREIRKAFLDYFESKQHKIVPSSPMVVQNDPTLMFINSGMAPFKDIFLGISPIKFTRVADTQKCLRVSGKHNDLEEVGVVKDGNKKSMDEGRLIVTISGELILDWQKKFTGLFAIVLATDSADRPST